MKKTKKEYGVAVLLWGAVLCWMLLIFIFSARPGTDSKQQSQLLLDKIEPVMAKVEATLQVELPSRDLIHVLIRKSAHVGAYLGLTLLLLMALKQIGHRGRALYGYAWAIAAAYAVFDEYHQTLVPGRSGEMRDVLVDHLGIFMALLLVAGLFRIRREKAGRASLNSQ